MSSPGEEQPLPDNVTPINVERTVEAMSNSASQTKPDFVPDRGSKPGAATINADKSAAENDVDRDLRKQLQEARELLFYASDEGIHIDDTTIRTIVVHSQKNKLDDEDAVSAIKAIACLSATLRNKANKSIKPFLFSVVALGIMLLTISTLSFIAGMYSKALSDEIGAGNQLALGLNAANTSQIADAQMSQQAITDTETLTAVQQFAVRIREIHETSRFLAWFVWVPALQDESLIVRGAPSASSPLEVRVPVTYGQIKEKTEQFQTVRAYAKSLQDMQNAFYGALANSILPSLYAILGVCTYLLKTFSEQVKAHTFRLSADAEGARFIIAAIAGGVIGLFNNFTSSEGNALSLLAIAFLIGYATDVFFTFLDGLEHAFMKGKSDDKERAGGSAA